MTLTRLIVGTPRWGIPAPKPTLRPPRVSPCLEPIEYGNNLLNDPSFETYSDLPIYPETAAGLEPDFAGVAIPRRRWVQADFYDGTETNWTISTAAPRTGTRHARMVLAATPETSRTGVWWIEQEICLPTDDYLAYSARVNPGDLIKVSAWAKSDAGGDTLQMQIHVSAAGGVPIVDNGSGLVLTTSYSLAEHQIFAPAGARYALVGFGNVGDGPYTIDVDDFALQVA